MNECMDGPQDPCPGEGSVKMGCLPLFQFIVPPSTMTPPTVVPWPPIHFVADSTSDVAAHPS